MYSWLKQKFSAKKNQRFAEPKKTAPTVNPGLDDIDAMYTELKHRDIKKSDYQDNVAKLIYLADKATKTADAYKIILILLAADKPDFNRPEFDKKLADLLQHVVAHPMQTPPDAALLKIFAAALDKSGPREAISIGKQHADLQKDLLVLIGTKIAQAMVVDGKTQDLYSFCSALRRELLVVNSVLYSLEVRSLVNELIKTELNSLDKNFIPTVEKTILVCLRYLDWDFPGRELYVVNTNFPDAGKAEQDLKLAVQDYLSYAVKNQQPISEALLKRVHGVFATEEEKEEIKKILSGSSDDKDGKSQIAKY